MLTMIVQHAFKMCFQQKGHHISDHLLRPNIFSFFYLVIILHKGRYLGKVKRKKCLHARVAAHSVTLQAKYFTSQIEKKMFLNMTNQCAGEPNKSRKEYLGLLGKINTSYFD